MKKYKAFIPLSIIFLLALFIYFTGYYKMISFDNLREHHKELREIASENKILAPLFFIIIYAISAAISIPGGFFLSLFSGFLFPHPWRNFYVIIGMTMGAMIIFLAARAAFKVIPKEKAGPWLVKMDEGFRKNATSYMLFLRLIPFFPFWLVNFLAAFFNVRTRTYFWTTLLGIAPQVFIFTQVGSGLNNVFETKEAFSFAHVLNPEVKIALVCLGICALIPIVIKNWRKKKIAEKDF